MDSRCTHLKITNKVVPWFIRRNHDTLALCVLERLSPLQDTRLRSVPLDIEAIRRKARAAIRPLKTVSSDFFGRNRTKAGRGLPEYHLVYFLLVDLLGFENLGRHEKLAWSIPVDLDGGVLFIEYRKMGLGVFSSHNTDSEDAAREVVRLVKRGVKVAQPYFDWRAQDAVMRSQVNVRNRSSQLHDRFQFLLDLYAAKHTESEAASKVSSSGFTLPDYRVRREMEWLALSVIESFFSWTEHVFIHLAILQGKCTTGDGIGNLAAGEWGSKFKTALDISDPTLKRYYDELTSVRNQVRNFVAHGAFGKDGEAFRFHSGAGAVPVLLPHHLGHLSYRFPDSLNLSRRNIDSSDHDAIALIQDFISHIRSGPLAPAWIYLDSGEDLILTMAQSGTYQLAMASEEAMTEFIEGLTYFNDMHANMDW